MNLLPKKSELYHKNKNIHSWELDLFYSLSLSLSLSLESILLWPFVNFSFTAFMILSFDGQLEVHKASQKRKKEREGGRERGRESWLTLPFSSSSLSLSFPLLFLASVIPNFFPSILFRDSRWSLYSHSSALATPSDTECFKFFSNHLFWIDNLKVTLSHCWFSFSRRLKSK